MNNTKCLGIYAGAALLTEDVDSEVAAGVSELNLAARLIENKVGHYEEVLFHRKSFFAREDMDKRHVFLEYQLKLLGHNPFIAQSHTHTMSLTLTKSLNLQTDIFGGQWKL